MQVNIGKYSWFLIFEGIRYKFEHLYLLLYMHVSYLHRNIIKLIIFVRIQCKTNYFRSCYIISSGKKINEVSIEKAWIFTFVPISIVLL